MSTRTRIWLLVIAVIVLGYPLAAWVIGFVVQGQIAERERLALQQAAPYVSITEGSYHRGVYESTLVSTIGLKSPALKDVASSAAASAFQVTVRSTIHHGPLPGLRTFALATIDTEFALPPELQKRIDALLGGKKFMTMHTTMRWFGGYQTDFSSPAFKGEIGHDTTLSSSGAVGTATATHNLASSTMSFDTRSLGVAGTRFQMQLDDLHAQAALTRAFKELNVGDLSFTLGRLEGHGKNADGADTEFSLQRLALVGKSSVTGDYVDMRGGLTAASLKAPKFNATHMGYEFAISHVYGPPLVDLTNGMQEINRTLPASASAERLQKLTEIFRKDGPDLLAHDPVIEITRIGFVTTEGELKISAKFTAPGLKREDVAEPGPAMTAALIQHLQAQADIRVDTDLLDKLTEGTPGSGVDKFAAQVRSLESQGYITQDGKTLSTHIVFQNSKLSVNGKPFPPARPQ